MKALVFLTSWIAALRHQNKKRGGFALIKLGGLVSEIRGSIGSHTFARNKSGAYVRSRTIPVNPRAPLQQEIRSLIAQLRDRWLTTLTEAQREAWGVYAKNTLMTNRLGESVTLTGWNQYCRSNLSIGYTGGDFVDAAPVEFALPEQDPSVVVTASDAAENNLSIAFDDTLPWASEVGAHLVVFASRPQNATKNFFVGPYRYAGKISGAAEAPESPETLTSPFALNDGQKVFLQFRIQRADGRLSAPFRVEALVS